MTTYVHFETEEELNLWLDHYEQAGHNCGYTSSTLVRNRAIVSDFCRQVGQWRRSGVSYSKKDTPNAH